MGPLRVDTRDWVLQLIERIYAAITEPGAWNEVLLGLSDRFGGSSVSLMVKGASAPRPEWIVCEKVDPSTIVEYDTIYSPMDTLLTTGLSAVPPGQVASFDEACPRSVYSRMLVYNDFYLRRGLGECAAVFLQPSPRHIGVLACYRPTRAGPFGEEERRAITLLVPHVARALQTSRHLRRADAAGWSFTTALDRLQAGVLIVSGAGLVLFANRRANEVVCERDGLVFQRNVGGGLELRALSAEDNERLARLLANACETGRGDGLSAGGATLVARSSLKAPYQVLVCPIRAAPGDRALGVGPAAALVFIFDPTLQPAQAEVWLQQLYGLTAAEARLAIHLLSGESPEEASERIGVSISTTRTQIRALLRKTGADRLTSLVRLLAAGPVSSVR